MKKNILFLILLNLPIVLSANNEIWTISADIANFGNVNFYVVSEKSDNGLIFKSLENRDKLILGSAKANLLRMFIKRKNKSSIPTADFLTNEFQSLEGAGVQPDIKVKAQKALNFVLKK